MDLQEWFVAAGCSIVGGLLGRFLPTKKEQTDYYHQLVKLYSEEVTACKKECAELHSKLASYSIESLNLRERISSQDKQLMKMEETIGELERKIEKLQKQ